jgi:hypothetical protein
MFSTLRRLPQPRQLTASYNPGAVTAAAAMSPLRVIAFSALRHRRFEDLWQSTIIAIGIEGI